MTLQQITAIQDELLRQHQQQTSSNLAEVAQQDQPPSDVEQYTIATDEDLPPLEPIPQEEEEEEQEEDEEEDEIEEVMRIFEEIEMHKSDKAITKHTLSKFNLNNWASINPKIQSHNTLITLFKIAEKMGKLNHEEQQRFNDIYYKYKSKEIDQYTMKTGADELFYQTFQQGKEYTTIEELSLYQTNLVYWNNDIETMKQNPKITSDDLLFQLYLRGQLKETDEKAINELPDDLSKKIYLLKIVEQLIGDTPEDNEWQITINDELLRKRKREWKERGKRRRITGKQPPPTETQMASSSSSSSTPLRDIAVAGAKAGAQELAKAGAQALAKSFLPV